MGKCTITKVNGVYSGDVEKFGVAEWTVPKNASLNTFNIGNYAGQVLTWDGGVVVKNYNETTTYTSPYTISDSVTGSSAIKIGSGSSGGTLSLKSKYISDNRGGNGNGQVRFPLRFHNDLDHIALWWNGNVFDNGLNKGLSGNIAALKDFSLKSITIEESLYIHGSLSDIASMTGMETCRLLGTSIIGDISAFGNMNSIKIVSLGIRSGSDFITGNIVDVFGDKTALTTLTIYFSPNITGTVEDFVAAQRAAGRTTGSMTVGFSGTSVTLRGGSVGYSTLTWDDSTITITPK